MKLLSLKCSRKLMVASTTATDVSVLMEVSHGRLPFPSDLMFICVCINLCGRWAKNKVSLSLAFSRDNLLLHCAYFRNNIPEKIAIQKIQAKLRLGTLLPARC